MTADHGRAQRLHQVRRLGAQLIAGVEELAHLLHESAIRAFARHLEALDLLLELAERLLDRRDLSLRELEELLRIALQRIRGERVERIRERRLRVVHELLLLLEALALRLDGCGERLLLACDVEDRAALLGKAEAARLDLLLQVGDAGGERLERGAAVRFLAQLCYGVVTLAGGLARLVTRLSQLFFGLLGPLPREREVRTHRPRAEEPPGERAEP